MHAYVLMTNHMYLLVSTEETNVVGAVTKALGQRYVQYINKTYNRNGTLADGLCRRVTAGKAGRPKNVKPEF